MAPEGTWPALAEQIAIYSYATDWKSTKFATDKTTAIYAFALSYVFGKSYIDMLMLYMLKSLIGGAETLLPKNIWSV